MSAFAHTLVLLALLFCFGLAQADAAQQEKYSAIYSEPLDKHITSTAKRLAGLKTHDHPAPQIAIVIDDLGYQLASGRLLAELPYPITLAIIPGSPFASDIGSLATKNAQELILHVPMETVHEKQWELGLTAAMSYHDFRDYIRLAVKGYPGVIGINNHGGSKLTADKEKMDWLMEFLVQEDMFFLDSRTTQHSVAITKAEKYKVAHTARDVFLDNQRSESSIRAAFNKTRKIARKHGTAIAIGHPYPETLAELKKQLPMLVAEGFQLRFCSSLTRY